MKHILLALLLLCSVQGHAQEEWQQTFQQLTNLEDAETESWEQDYEMLSELNQQPLDLNSATRDELEALPFLTAATCALGFYLLLGKDYFLIPTLITCLIALLMLRRPIEAKEAREDA